MYIQIGKENRRKYYESYIKTGEMRDTVITRGADPNADSNANAPNALAFSRMRLRCECDLSFL